MIHILPTKVLSFRGLAVLFVICLACASRAQALSTKDAQVFAVFDQFNAQDIESASLAVTRGTSDPVRAVGHMIVMDHVPLLDEVRAMARQQGVGYSVNNNNERARTHRQLMMSLMENTGIDFDRMYLKHELSFSKDFIKTVKDRLIPEAQNPELKNYLAKTLTRFEVHLSHIEHATATLSDNSGMKHEHTHNHDHQPLKYPAPTN